MAVTAAGVASELDAFLRDVSTLGNANAASNVPLLGNLTLPTGTGFFDQLRADIASTLSGVADDPMRSQRRSTALPASMSSSAAEGSTFRSPRVTPSISGPSGSTSPPP